jgi:hypothetical protein
LKIERKMKNRLANKEGFLKGKVAKKYEYDIEVKILKSTDHSLKLMDRMVHSNSEKIKIGKFESNFTPESTNLGILTWNLPLKGEKDFSIEYEYTVEYEKEIQIRPPLP